MPVCRQQDGKMNLSIKKFRGFVDFINNFARQMKFVIQNPVQNFQYPKGMGVSMIQVIAV